MNKEQKKQTSSSVDSGRTESLPYNSFTDVGGNKQRDSENKIIYICTSLSQWTQLQYIAQIGLAQQSSHILVNIVNIKWL